MTKEELQRQNLRFKYKGFKLISLELKKFSIFGNIKYDFIDNEDLQNKIYTTVIIGPNGTRKSLLFNLIIYIFKTIESQKINGGVDHSTYKHGDYSMIYALNNEIYEIKRVHSFDKRENSKYEYTYYRNGDDYKVSDFELPTTIIGNSINITDRFPFFKGNDFSRFQYLGIKYNPQSASTKSYIKKTIDFVAKLSFSTPFLNSLNLITETFLGENKTVCISYRTSNNKIFFNGNLSIDSLDNFFIDIEQRFKERQKTPPFKLNFYKSIKTKSPDSIVKAVNFCNLLVTEDQLLKIHNSSAKQLKFNLSNQKDLERLKEYNETLNVLYSLNLLVDPKIELTSTSGTYSLENSSSGEHNLITSLIGIISTIKQNSLLLIDEPEISLHPNWQMQYISFLKRVLSDDIYNESHIIIASHSHFIVSDLEQDSSKVIGLTNKERLEIVPFSKDLNTYGWSAEEVLLKVFNVTTSRNYFVAEKLGLMLDFIASEDSTNELIRDKFYELELDKINGLTDEDPLKTVFDTIITEYVSEKSK